MFDEAIDDSLAALELIPDCFVTSKMIKNLYTDLYPDNGLLFFDEDSHFVPGIVNLKSVKNLKKDKIRINANSLAS